MSTTTGSFAKLTVPQLKALCKERRIVGYSRLGKAALIQKLLTSTAGTTKIQSNDAVQSAYPIPTTSEKRALEILESTDHPPSPVHQVVVRSSQVISSNDLRSVQGATTVLSANQPTQFKLLPVSSLTNSVTKSSALDRQLSPSLINRGFQAPDADHRTKRPCIPTEVKSAKKQKISAAISVCHADPSSSTNNSAASASTFTKHVSPNVVTSQCLAAPASCPPHRSSVSISVHSASQRPQLVQKEALAKRHGRFKPLVLAKPLVVSSTPANDQRTPLDDYPADEIACVSSGIFSLDAAPHSTPPFVNITLPPKLCDRKRVQRWAIILCALSDEDRQTCVLVSRAFRYAVYLSAAHILAQKFHGRRLDKLMKRYPQNVTNMWPYLRQRRNEVAFWKQAFRNSFLGRYCSAFDIEPLSARLWTSPDDEKQAIIALRFVLTRLWFTLSIGTNERESSVWLKHTVDDAQEVVKGEIWAITIREGNSLSVFHILESTCEVIGREGNTPQIEIYPSCLRSDWSEYISSHTNASVETRSLILEYFRWTNHEEYNRGISRHWLRRISGEGDAGLCKRVVAERYVMACVVANSVSGRWMSAHQMAQEFAGQPSITIVNTEKTPKVNLYLPAHHHVESVHFRTSKNVPLHPALAVVQTPAREYIILRDNGMQVGCEEDGVATVWMHVLGCDQNGVAVGCTE